MMNRLALVSLVAVVLGAAASVSPAQAPSEEEMRRLMEQARQMQQNMPMPDPAQLEQLQAHAARMQACLQNVDQDALGQMQHEGEALAREIQALCASGERDAAQARAIDYGRRMAASPEIAELAKCGEMMRGMMPSLAGIIADGGMPDGATHVCDGPMQP